MAWQYSNGVFFNNFGMSLLSHNMIMRSIKYDAFYERVTTYFNHLYPIEENIKSLNDWQ